MDEVIRSDLENITKDSIIEDITDGTVLITGAGGMIGSYLVHFYMYLAREKQRAMKVLALVRRGKEAEKIFGEYLEDSRFRLIEQDVCEELNVDVPVDCIIHAASLASPKYYLKDPVGVLKPNTIGTYQLLEFARKNRVKNVLFISSGEVYGIPRNTPSAENDYGYVDLGEVRSCYAESKRMGEVMCVSYHEQYQVPVRIARLFHTYGPGISLDDGRIFGDIASGVVKEKKLMLRSDGSAVRTFCYIADAILGMMYALYRGEAGESYNIGNGQGVCSILDLMTMISEEYGIPLKREPVRENYLPSPIKVNQPSLEKIVSLGFCPCYSMKEGFAHMIRWAKAEYSKIVKERSDNVSIGIL